MTEADTGCDHPNHGNPDHDCKPFVATAPPLTMTAGEYLDTLAHAWDAGWRAHMDYLAAVTVWSASEGAETPEALHARNPYRVIPPSSSALIERDS